MNFKALFSSVVVLLSLGVVAVSVLPHLCEPLNLTPPDSIPVEYANDWHHAEIDDSEMYGDNISGHTTVMYGLTGFSLINYVDGEISNEHTENITLDDLNEVECEGETKEDCEALVLATKVGIYGSYTALGIGLLSLISGLVVTFNKGSPKITAALVVIFGLTMIGYAGFHAATIPPIFFGELDFPIDEHPGVNAYATIVAGVLTLLSGCLVFTSETDDW